MKKNTRYLLPILMIAFFLELIADVTAQSKSKQYVDEIKQWDEKRLSVLKGATGWVNLAGLYWLKQGENSFGSASTNALVFKHDAFPANLGKFILDGTEVRWETAEGNEVTEKNIPFKSGVIFKIDPPSTVSLSYKTFRWSIIKREELIGVRFRDLANPALEALKKIDRYKPSEDWVLEAEFKPSLVPTITTTNVLGQSYQQPHPGKIIFKIEDKSYSLDVVDEGEEGQYHIVFGDATNGDATYASGRFIDIPKPDANGLTKIDFNKAYNPPCAFSEFSTCPIPTKANTLPVAIKAGEKKVH
jgi:uncharacterized protein (DUF1684 family)